MKKSIWGPHIWLFLHLLSMRIKQEYFIQDKKEIIKQINQICSNLPCPTCSAHATITLKKLNLSRVNTKEQLTKCIFLLHNEVNKRLKKPEFKEEELINHYKVYDFQKAAKNYIKVMNTSNYSERMLLHSFNKKRFLKDFIEYIKNNIHKYDIILNEI